MFDQGWCVFGGGNLDVCQVVVVVVGIGGFVIVGIFVGDQFVSGVVVIVLVMIVEVGFFYQMVQQVVVELCLDVVFVGQGDQFVGFVVQVG